jgi:hypothetical protein
MGEDASDRTGDERRERMAAQLRANLRRRKAQLRARRAATAEGAAEADDARPDDG